MTKTSRLKRQLAESISRTYRIFLVIFFSLMAVFFTSKIWLPSDVKIQSSSIGTKKATTSGTEITLKSWQYNPSNHFMEAAFSYDNSDGTQDIKFVTAAHTDTNKAVKMDVSIPYSSNGFLVVQFQNVPQNWDVISLWIDSSSQISSLLPGTDSDIGLESSSESPDNNKENQGANFLCDIRKVSVNQSLKPQASLYYSLQSVDNEISAGKRQIAALKEKANGANADISQLSFDISALKSNQKYQTPEEIEQSNATIQNKNSQINNLKNDIVQYQSGIRNGQQKLKKLQQKWIDIKSGKFKDANTKSAAASSPVASEAPPSSLPSTAENSSESVMAD